DFWYVDTGQFIGNANNLIDATDCSVDQTFNARNNAAKDATNRIPNLSKNSSGCVGCSIPRFGEPSANFANDILD
ncbi:hypothetical protein ACXWQD_10105, partial [Streptococcus pyogenes]